MRRITRNLFIAVVLFCAMAGIVSAATVTQNINYQGKLADSSGNPLTGTYSITFKLYDSSSGLTPLQTITQPTVQCTSGIFNTNLAFSSSYFDGRALWLGIAVGSDAEMTPRQELRPVPYALSLRPNAWVMGTDFNSTLNLLNSGGGMALNATTTAPDSYGVSVVTSGTGSYGVYSSTSNTDSHGVYASTEGADSYGVLSETSGTDSHGIKSYTTGTGSYGVEVFTSGSDSNGVNISTKGQRSPGIEIITENGNSPGIGLLTNGYGSYGIEVFTKGGLSPGIYSDTWGLHSPGLETMTRGKNSPGLWASANYNGDDSSPGIHSYSLNSYGIDADTGRTDHMYGVYTPDYMNAARYDTNATDVAEYMPVAGDVTPGTVLIISENGKLAESTTAYDTRVAGIVSTEPGISLGTKNTGNAGEEQIAVAGRVPCKVDASYGAIHPGDVLTTSPNPGYAMKAEPVDIGGIKIYRPSTVLGKAMGTLESGTAVIEVLVTLQ
jgi:hypothetical protein